MLFYVDSVGDKHEPNTYYEFWCCQPEKEDKDYIREYVVENYPEYFDGDGTDTISIPFINPITEEEVEIEINLKEWL